METIEEHVKRVIAEQVGIEVNNVAGNSTLEDLGGDSLDGIETIMALEEEFDIEISEEVSDKFTDVASIVEYITEQVA